MQFYFLSQTSTSDSPNSLYLKIFGFIRFDFMCFGDKEICCLPSLSFKSTEFEFEFAIRIPSAS